MLNKFMSWLGYEKAKVSVVEYAAYLMIKDLHDVLSKLPLEGDVDVPVLNIPVDILEMSDKFEHNLLSGKYVITLK